MRDGHIKIISKFKRDLSDKVKMNKYEDFTKVDKKKRKFDK